MGRVSRSLLTLVALLVVLLVLHRTALFAPVENALIGALRTPQHWLVTAFPKKAEPRADADATIRILQEKVAALTAQNVRLTQDVDASRAVLEQQHFLEQQGLVGSQARVIGRNPEGDDQLIILDKGKESDVTEGSPVLAGNGALVGIIQSSQEGRSTVLLLTSTQTSLGAEVQNDTKSTGIVSGEHGLTLRMKLIQPSEKITVGDHVATGTLNERIPRGLVIGDITAVHFRVGDLFQEATIQPITDLQRLTVVTILHP